MRSCILWVIVLMATTAFAQGDSTAYSAQRDRINKLLEERSLRFSRYDQSLTQRSGIFGLKTKRDMQASNDILTQIVLNDNDIFSELKVLLDFNNFEKAEVEARAESSEDRLARFQTTITKLQIENDRLTAQIAEQSTAYRKLIFITVFAFLMFIMALVYIIRAKKLRKTDI